MKKICEICKWWHINKENFGSCGNFKFFDDIIFPPGDYDLRRLETYGDFGCIHWQAKDEEQTK